MSDKAGVHRRLLLAQGMLERSDALARTGDPLDRMLSLLVAHQAVEITVRAVADELGGVAADSKGQYGLLELLKLIDRELETKKEPRLPLRNKIELLNRRRNLTQHAGDPVAQETLDENRIDARVFMAGAYERFFSADLGSMSRVDLIDDATLRSLFNMARQLSEQGGEHMMRAYAVLVVAFRCALESWASAHVPSVFPPAGAPMGAWTDFQNLARQQTYQLALLATGVNPLEVMKLQSRAPAVSTMGGGRLVLQTRGGAPYTCEELDVAEAFAIEAILKWQRAGYRPHAELEEYTLVQIKEWVAKAQEAQARVGSIGRESEGGAPAGHAAQPEG